MKQTIMVMTKIFPDRSSQQGLTFTELLSGVVMGSIVLTAAASGFVNLLRANQDVESKTVRHAGLIKALNYLQEDIKGAKSVTKEKVGTGVCNSSGVDSEYCLVLTYPNNTPLRAGCTNSPKIYYGLRDISGTSPQIWLKPAILRRKIDCGINNQGNWIVVADGLLGKKEANPVTDKNNFCTQDSVNWTGNLDVYGDMKDEKGGFRFCLHEDNEQNRLVRIFLYGYIGKGQSISLNTISFTRSQ
ncbi:PulJ/GspJ family protein [Geminocystis sp. CENA526]|uniref:PulJ/GspJ family protein n=1 Tax=Geminocystis sp. CENA526 TaxID=1355871 RepID=UPI003D6E6AF4